MKEAAELLSGAPARLGPAQLAERWDSLPDPVRRYLRLAIPDPAAAPETGTCHLTHGGTFRTSLSARWLPVDADEFHTVSEPGFVWQARFHPMPLVNLKVTDMLFHGHGTGRVHAAGRVPVSRMSGPEVDQSASARWLMEAVWFPYAFVGPHVHWEPIDNTAARVSLTSIPDVSVEMHFDAGSGLPRTVESDRYMAKAKRPFRGACSEFRSHSGFLIPTRMKGSWLLPEGEFSCIDFELHTIEYNPVI
ncbi:MAG: DUF6544 family protein [Bryobacteraceae bacterium]|nr:DUF6544 family protein [Bryobacteraceae bacterium]